MSGQDLGAVRRFMVSNQLRPNKVTDPAVLAAMEALPRERFAGEGQGAVCYRDTVLPLGGARGLNPPIATGRLLDRARVAVGDRVLVVGAGTGYVAALLVMMGAEVIALEQDTALVERARTALQGTGGVTLVEGPLAEGWAAAAPYDLLYIDGAVERVPPAFAGQLAPAGRLVGALLDRSVTHLIEGRAAPGGFGVTAFADVEVATLPGFAPAPAFAF